MKKSEDFSLWENNNFPKPSEIAVISEVLFFGGKPK